MEALSATLNRDLVQDSGFEAISFNGATLAMVIRASFLQDGIHFLTPDEFPQQLAVMGHPAGKIIGAHLHSRAPRLIERTQEVLFIRRGRMRADIYSPDRRFLTSRILNAGNVIFLAAAGHGFEVLEDTSFIEVKQGPFMGDTEKARFASVPRGQGGDVDASEFVHSELGEASLDSRK
ncbi:hypothetical protein BRCH_01430 [Candidatus Burkholderia brachyanthoides]|nr:hypothetical protein BRCH_01430 [Candidatus Burkholderia brachyanthoides]